MTGKESEITNATRTCNKEANKLKENFILYVNKGKENTSRTSEKRVKARDGYVCMYEWGKHFCHSTYE